MLLGGWDNNASGVLVWQELQCTTCYYRQIQANIGNYGLPIITIRYFRGKVVTTRYYR